MPYRDREYLYHLDDQLIVNRYAPEIRQLEFKLLIYLYREAGYDIARQYLDGLIQFETVRNSPGYVKPEPTNQHRRHGNWWNGKPIEDFVKGTPGKKSDLKGLNTLEIGQQQTALRMLKDYGIEISQKYVNSCLKLHKDVEYQNEQAS